MVPDLALIDIEGQTRKLSDLKQHRVVVIALTSTSCPLSKKFGPTLARLEQDYQLKNVAFVYVNPAQREVSDDLREAIKKSRFAGPYILDSDGAVGSALGATQSTDAFVLDAQRTVVYRGAVDDQYGIGYALDAPRRQYLVEAIEAALRGARPEIQATEAPGCPLDVHQAIPEDAAAGVTFHNRISRLLQSHCVECHRHGGSAPFALESADDVLAQAAPIQRAVERGLMPPWFAAAPAAGEKSKWSNDRTLPPRDKSDLLDWLAAGRPLGEPQEAPLLRQFHNDWQIGKPDLIVQISKPIAVKATGTMPYQDVFADTGLTKDKWIQSIEIRPTAREVVHHALAFAMAPGDTPAHDKVNAEQAAAVHQRGFFAAYVPGNSTIVLPDGFAKLLPAGSRLWLQIHYAPNGVEATDQMEIGMVFARERPQNVVQVKGIVNANLSIPPGADNHPEMGLLKLGADSRITAFMPHLHLRGKAFRYEALFPDGRVQVLLDVPRYDSNWQLLYRLEQPIDCPRGTILKGTAWFDNSSGNPANPDPGATVRFGPQATDEMLVGYVEYHQPKGGFANPKAARKLPGNGDNRRIRFR